MRRVIGSFKARLTLTMAGVFVTASAGLMLGQLLVLHAALDRNINEISLGNSAPMPISTSASGDIVFPPVGETCASTAPPQADATAGQAEAGDCASAATRAPGLSTGGASPSQSSVAVDIMRDTALGSLVLLLCFAAVAALLAWWLTRRALARVGEVTGLARDISEHDLSRRLNLAGPRDEIKELADTMDIMLARLEGAFESQQRFVANASHELRGPLTASRTALEAPLSQGRFPIEVRSSVLRALEANKRSESLITALLQLARSRVIHETRPQSCDLRQITEAMVEALADDSTALGIVIETDLPVAVPLSGHETLLTHAVFNLVDNAIGHNHQDGWVRVAVSGTPTSAELVIENTGTVYTPEDACQLTEPFHRGTGTRLARPDGRQGLGLGLALVESITRAHHGLLDITPRAAGGLHVRWSLPRTPTTGQLRT